MAKKKTPPAKPTRGHWPAGKRRHEIPAEWTDIKARILRAVRAPDMRTRKSARENGPRLSLRGVAEFIGVHERTVRRWMRGVDIPPTEAMAKLARYLKRVKR